MKEKLFCPICGGQRIIEDGGELICGECGCVIEQLLDRGPEWKAYGYGDKLRRERAGAPLTPLLHDMGFSTIGEGKLRIKPGSERRMIEVFSEIYKLASSLNLPEYVAERAALLYRRAERMGLIRGKDRLALPAALLLLSSRIFGIPRFLREFSRLSGIREGAIMKCYLRLLLGLGIKAPRNGDTYISRFSRALGLSGEVEKAANLLLAMAKKHGLTQGRSLRCIAAAAIYIACKALRVRIDQRTLSRTAYMSPVTLRKRYKELLRVLSLDKDLGAWNASKAHEARGEGYQAPA